MNIDKTCNQHDVKSMSEIINFLRIPLIIMVVFLHSYTATQNMDWVGRSGQWYTFITYELSLVLGNAAVPIFFFISGYLFFLHDYNGKIDYEKKWSNRIDTLLVPYFLWNLIVICVYLVFQLMPSTSLYFSNEHNIICEYSLSDFFRAFWDCGDWNKGNGTPILSPFWFIRNLIIMSLCTPIFHLLNKYLKMWWLLPVAILWCVTYNMATPYASVLFFGVGTFLGEKKINMIYAHRRVIISIIFFEFALLIVHNILHFYTDHLIIALITQRLMYILAIPIFFYIGIDIVRKYNIKWKNTSALAFVIFAVHYPVLLMLRKVLVKAFPMAGDAISVFFYFFAVVVTLFVCWVFYLILKKIPFLRSVLCGGR